MTLQLLHFEFLYIWGKFDFLFYRCSKSGFLVAKFIQSVAATTTKSPSKSILWQVSLFPFFYNSIYSKYWSHIFPKYLRQSSKNISSVFITAVKSCYTAVGSSIWALWVFGTEAEFMNVQFHFVEVSRHNLESSQTWGFRIQCLPYKRVSNHFY